MFNVKEDLRGLFIPKDEEEKIASHLKDDGFRGQIVIEKDDYDWQKNKKKKPKSKKKRRKNEPGCLFDPVD